MKKKPMHKPKHIVQELKRLSERLKPVKYTYLEYLDKPYFQDAEGTLHNEQAEEGEPQRRRVWRVIQEREGNHKRRVKKAYQLWGEQGAVAYLAAFQKEDDPIIKFKTEENDTKI